MAVKVPVARVPLSACIPLHAPVALQAVALVVLQVMVLEPPLAR